ncbi:MAG: hypothetical protein H7203_15095 [Rhizobacter sp.]|nr:hypothetical protein [Burkholderiales bacterium]
MRAGFSVRASLTLFGAKAECDANDPLHGETGPKPWPHLGDGAPRFTGSCGRTLSG